MRSIFLAVILSIGLWGCGGGPTAPTPAPVPVPVPGAPAVTCPAPISATTTAPAGTTVRFETPVAVGGQAPVTVACTPASGATFPVGASTVACRATDALNQTGSCQFPVTVALLPTLSRTRFLAFGDSITDGEVTVPVTSAFETGRFPNFRLVLVPSASYPSQLRDQLHARYVTQSASIVVTSAGKGAEWAADGALRFPDVMATVRPEVVLLLEGYNDLHALGAGGIGPAVAAIDSMAKEARHRGARVFIAALTPPRPGGVNTLPVSAVTTYNGQLRIIATGEGAVFVDLYAALVSDVNTYIGIDGLHPTEAGYRRMADAFFAAIRADLEVR